MIAAEPWAIWIQGKKLVSELEETIYNVVQSPDALAYWSSKEEFPEKALETVNWDAIGMAMKESKRSR
jgi:hypothetical protein